MEEVEIGSEEVEIGAEWIKVEVSDDIEVPVASAAVVKKEKKFSCQSCTISFTLEKSLQDRALGKQLPWMCKRKKGFYLLRQEQKVENSSFPPFT